MGLGLKYKNGQHIFDEREEKGVPYLSFPLLEQTGVVRHGFSTRLGGVSKGHCATMNISTTRGDEPEAIEENRRRIAAAIGVEPTDFTYTHQTHTTNVAVVEEKDRGGKFLDTDGMVTDVPGICLVTFYADCVPLFFVDPVHRAIGLSHSGWRGTVGRMGKVTLELMQEQYGTDPTQVFAAIGPSICQECYEVSGDVAEQFIRMLGEAVAIPGREPGKYQLDLWLANELILRQAGLLPAHIAVTDICTCHNSGYLFSHRASGGRRGSLAAFLALKD